jgi:hypothetical protein
MLATPLRDSILGKYGFDLKLQFNTLAERFLSKGHNLETDFEKFTLATYYVEMKLYWEDVLHNTGVSDFHKIFEKHAPDIIPISNLLMQKIRNYGYDTPENTKALYEDILNSFSIDNVKLNTILAVTNPK